MPLDGERSHPLIVERCFVDPIHEWCIADDAATSGKDSRHLLAKLGRIGNVLENVGQEDRVEGCIQEGKRLGKVEEHVRIGVGMQGIRPVGAYDRRGAGAVEAEHRCFPASQVEKAPLGMEWNLSRVEFSDLLGRDPRCRSKLEGVLRGRETTIGQDILRFLPDLVEFHRAPFQIPWSDFPIAARNSLIRCGITM